MSTVAARSRFAWCITGSGHFLEESLALAARLPAVDLFLSAAAEEVLPIYKIGIDDLRPDFRIFRDKTASAVPVGTLYEDVYHTVVVLTGRLAEASLARVLGGITEAPFSWEVREIGLQVAALMTAEMIQRRVAAPVQADRIMVPGRCRGDLEALTRHYGIPVERGP